MATAVKYQCGGESAAEAGNSKAGCFCFEKVKTSTTKLHLKGL